MTAAFYLYFNFILEIAFVTFHCFKKFIFHCNSFFSFHEQTDLQGIHLNMRSTVFVVGKLTDTRNVVRFKIVL